MAEGNNDQADKGQQDDEVEIEVEQDDSKQAKDDSEGQTNASNNDSEDQTDEDEDYKEKWLRAQADYRNLKKEMANKRDEWRERITFQVLEDFIPVFDNFKKAYEHKPENKEDSDLDEWENWAQGMEFILKQFDDILDDYNVTTIEAKGKEFKPALHNAIEKKFSSEFEQGMIMEVMESGYKTEDKVLKAAKVVVSKGPKQQSDGSEDSNGKEG